MPDFQDVPHLTLEFAFRLRLELGYREKIGETPFGSTRGFTASRGGKIEGPLLNGIVVPNSGGDWATYRKDNTVQFNSRYMLQADDGTQIYMQNTGYRHASPEIARKMEALEPVGHSDYYFRMTPVFETPVGKHDWMTRNVFVGTAQRNAEHSVFHYFVVR